MALKYTRKQLKKPDEFITLSHKVWVWVREHVTRVAAMLATTIVVVAVVWTWTHLRHSAAEKATGELMQGLETYARDVVADKSKDIPPSTPTPSGDDDKPRFESRAAKLDAILKQFGKVLDEHGADSEIGRVALVLRAGTYFERSDHDKAIADYNRFLDEAGKGDQLFDEAVEGLAFAYEAQKKWGKALEAIKRLPRDGERQFEALYHEARILAAKGDKKGAIKLYTRIAKDAESRFLVKNANQWLAALDQGA